MTEPQALPGTDIHSGTFSRCRCSYRSKKPTPGSSTQNPSPVSSSRMRFIRPRSSTIGARHARRVGAVAEILAARDRPERRLVLVGEAHDGLHFLHAARRKRGRCRPFVFRPGRIDVRIGVAVLVGGEHPVLAHHAFVGLQGLLEPRRRDARRQRQFARLQLRGRPALSAPPRPGVDCPHCQSPPTVPIQRRCCELRGISETHEPGDCKTQTIVNVERRRQDGA